MIDLFGPLGLRRKSENKTSPMQASASAAPCGAGHWQLACGQNCPLVHRGGHGEVCPKLRMVIANLLWNFYDKSELRKDISRTFSAPGDATAIGGDVHSDVPAVGGAVHSGLVIDGDMPATGGVGLLPQWRAHPNYHINMRQAELATFWISAGLPDNRWPEFLTWFARTAPGVLGNVNHSWHLVAAALQHQSAGLWRRCCVHKDSKRFYQVSNCCLSGPR